MKYYICDDNKDFSVELSRQITIIDSTAEVRCFDSIASLLFLLEDNSNIDAVFLDIKNSDGNGIDAAVKIRNINPLIKIIYVTGYVSRYSQAVFECQTGDEPIALLAKPIEERYLRNAIDKIKSGSPKVNQYITISCNRKTFYIDTEKIIYISSEKRQLYIYTIDDSYCYYGKIAEIAEQLPEHFCRCHKSYIVNMKKINNINGWNSFVMLGNHEIPIGKVYRESTKTAVISHKSALSS